jgi:hypothetical protein
MDRTHTTFKNRFSFFLYPVQQTNKCSGGEGKFMITLPGMKTQQPRNNISIEDGSRRLINIAMSSLQKAGI